MAAIETSPHPLVFKLENASELGFSVPANENVAMRTWARSLAGMQKEAIVGYGPTGTTWRMVCDEGPYLNGTDLAPFPLAFFSAGLAANFMSGILKALAEAKIGHRGITLLQDNVYGMDGSAIRGTMTGEALPVSLDVQVDSAAPAAAIQKAVTAALEASAGGALLRSVLDSAFTLSLNGEQLPTGRVKQLADPAGPAPVGFDAARPTAGNEFAADIIQKLEAATIVHGVEGGAGSSLSGEQKRLLQVRGICTLRDDGLKEIKVQLFKPIGSVFRFLSDDSRLVDGQERAPSGLAYLSAGIAFCYMTQIGRYSHIVKKPLESYRIVQDTCFSLADAEHAQAGCEAVKTHVYLETGEGEDYARTLVDMSEQTCFLHAACRAGVAVNSKVSKAKV
ncbi:MAG: OsmC family protein [Pseudomonadales bacterium]|nr:OsmC family protein [Pseudomonadales bacterium]